MRGSRIAAFVGTLALLVTGPAPAPRAGVPTCVAPPAADGHEPPCNPYLAHSVWSMPHRGPYNQDSTPLDGPRAGEIVTATHLPLNGVPVFLNFTGTYPDGGTAVWATAVTIPDQQQVYKIDYPSGRLIAAMSNPTTTGASASGAYALVDHRNRLVVGRGQTIDVYADAVPGDRMSGIAKIKELVLPASAVCRSTDRLIGIVMLWDGSVAFASQNGIVGVVPGEPDQMTPGNVRAVSINGEACATSSAPLEVVSNSIGADENGGIYTVTSQAQYKHAWDGATLSLAWRVAVPTDGFQGGIRLGPGSGSSPTLMGTAPSDDRLVVITDGRKAMHLMMLWRDEIPAGWEPIAPGADPRVVCDVPIDFGRSDIAAAQSEQSVVVRGYGAVVVNNSLRDSSVYDRLPQPLGAAAAVIGEGDPTNAPYGVERIDWDPATKTCSVAWTNPDVSIPNAIPVVSAGTNMVYAVGQRNGVWGLESLDFSTGASVLRADSSPLPFSNSFYSMTQIAPDNSIWTGTFGGMEIFRPVGSG